MQLKRNLKIFGMGLTIVCSSIVFAQSQPQPNGSSLGSTTTDGANSVSATRTTTNSTTTGTTGGMDSAPAVGTGTNPSQNPSDMTTMEPMDPSRDSRTGSDATMGNTRNRRAMGTSSGTAVPDSTTSPRF